MRANDRALKMLTFLLSKTAILDMFTFQNGYSFGCFCWYDCSLHYNMFVG